MKKGIFKTIMIAASVFILIVLLSETKVTAATVTRVKLDKKGVTMYTGNTLRLTAKVKADKSSDKEIEWSSTDSSVASVDSNGEVKAVKAGTAYIKATSKVNKKLYAKCKVTVLIDDSKDVKFSVMSIYGLQFEELDQIIVPSRIIRDSKELEKLIQQLEKNGNDISYFYRRTYKSFLKKLKGYDKSYFKNNVLYIGTYSMGETELMTGAVDRVAKANGKYKLRLTVADKYSDCDYAAINAHYCMFAEIPKSVAKTIDQVQVRYNSSHTLYKEKYEKPVIQKISSPSSGKVKLKMSAYHSLGTNMLIYRSTSRNGRYERVGKICMDSSTWTFTDDGLKSGKVYYYKIRGGGSYGFYGDYSNKVSVRVS